MPHENHDGSRSFKPFRKLSRFHIPDGFFARPLSDTNSSVPAESVAHTDEPGDEVEISSSAESGITPGVLIKNQRLALIIAATQSMGFLIPIWVIFGTDHLKLSLLLSLILGSTGWVTSAIFEVPMGAVADKYGRKISLVIGLGFCAIGDLSLVLLHNFWILILFQTLAGMGYAMRSGSFEGLLHDTFEAAGETTAYAKLSSHILFLVSASRVLTIPIGAWLFDAAPHASLSSNTWPYIGSVLAYCTALTCATMLVERRSSRKKLEETEIVSEKFALHLWEQTSATWREMMGNRDIKRVLTTIGLYAVIGEGNWALYQEYFRERSIKLSESSWIYAVMILIMALGSLYVTHVYKKINVMWAMNLMIAITTLDIVVMHLPLYFAVFGFALTAFIGSMSWYLQDNAIQNRISGERKTTSLSIASMVYTIGQMVGTYGVGAIAQHLGVLRAQWFFVVYGIIVVTGLGLWSLADGPGIRPEDARATGMDTLASDQSDE